MKNGDICPSCKAESKFKRLTRGWQCQSCGSVIQDSGSVLHHLGKVDT